MGQLLVMMIVPPVVGVVTYAVLRLLWKRGEQADHAAKQHRLDVN